MWSEALGKWQKYTLWWCQRVGSVTWCLNPMLGVHMQNNLWLWKRPRRLCARFQAASFITKAVFKWSGLPFSPPNYLRIASAMKKEARRAVCAIPGFLSHHWTDSALVMKKEAWKGACNLLGLLSCRQTGWGRLWRWKTCGGSRTPLGLLYHHRSTWGLRPCRLRQPFPKSFC